MQERLKSELIIHNNEVLKIPGANTKPGNPIIKSLQAGEVVKILGPCSLDGDPEQVEEILQDVRSEKSNPDDENEVIRGPGRKPRTDPETENGQLAFEGIGLEAAAQIYAEIIRRHPQVLFATEIMENDETPLEQDILLIAQHLALGWTGSRQQDQYALRKIGRVLASHHIPVMVKNSMLGMDLSLGMLKNVIIGVNKAAEKMGPEHQVPVLFSLRGVMPDDSVDRKVWRNKNNVDWIPLLRASFPDLPIIIDSSHLLKGEALTPQAQVDIIDSAIQAGANGYIIELTTHDKETQTGRKSKTDPGTNAKKTVRLLRQRGLA